MDRRILFCILFMLIFAQIAYADLNPKTIDSTRLRILQSGSFRTSGDISKVNLTMYIPQEGVENINVTGALWQYVNDTFGNRMIFLHWEKPRSTESYTVESIVNSRAKHTASLSQVGSNALFLQETSTVRFTDDIRKLAYPYEKTWENVARLTTLVNSLVEYDLSLVGAIKPSDWVLENRRGVCVEFANLLASLLRVSGIPARYIVGYAYSAIEKKFIGHTWVEVLASDGTWVPFDPTWHQGGYLDATHVKTANLLDSNQSDILMYVGRGSLAWTRTNETFVMLNYTIKKADTISLSGDETAARGSYGLLAARIASNECAIRDISMNSCVGADDRELFDIKDRERKLWACGPAELYWVYRASGSDYICPVSVYDQEGSYAEKNINVYGRLDDTRLFISGPDVAGLNENILLTASADGVFFSPNFTRNYAATWNLSFTRPGNYKFYLYSNNSIAEKTVSVIEQKEFSLSVALPRNVTLRSSFLVNVTVQNMQNKEKTSQISVSVENASQQKSILLSPLGSSSLVFNFTAGSAGMKTVSVAATGNSITTYSTIITVYEVKEWWQGIIDAIVGFFSGIFDAISDFFAGMSGGKVVSHTR